MSMVVVVVVVVDLFTYYLKHDYFYNDISIELDFMLGKPHDYPLRAKRVGR